MTQKKAMLRQDIPCKGLEVQRKLLEMVEFLLGDQSSWMTAQTITIDGGIGSIKS